MGLRIDKVLPGNIVFHNHKIEDIEDIVDGINDTHIDWGHGANQVSADDLPILQLGTPTWTNQQHHNNLFGSAGRATGGAITDAGSETVNVAAGTGFIKANDEDDDPLLAFNWSARNGLSCPTNSTRFIGVKYNDGTPIVDCRADQDWDLDTEFPLGSVINLNGNLYILDNPWWITDGTTNLIEKSIGLGGYLARDQFVGGLILGVTGTRNPTMTGGTVWGRTVEFEMSNIDYSAAGSFNTYWFESDGTVHETRLTYPNAQYPITQWNDIDNDQLDTIGNNQYAVWWVWLNVTNNELSFMYPKATYSNSASAEAEELPSHYPGDWYLEGLVIGRIIIKQGQDAPVEVQSAFTTQFTAAQAADHGNLAGLADDDHPQYILHSLADATNDFLVASEDNTFVKKTLAETGAILEGDISHDNLQGLTGTVGQYNHPTDAQMTVLGNTSNTNTGDQTSIVGITGTKDQFDTAVTDGDIIFEGDAPTAHATSHAVSGADTVFPADPGADRYLMWDDDPGELVWAEGVGSGASTALDNLASVAINTSLISDTDDTDDLGSSDKEWKDLYIDGTANIDSLVADTADINGGTIDGVTIATDCTQTEWDDAYTHIGESGASHTYINQNVTTTGTPTFASTLFTDKIKLTQTDGNEYIDSLADGYLDIGATTATRVNGNFQVISTSGTLNFTSASDGGDYNIFSSNGDQTLAFYGSAGNTLNLHLLDGTLRVDNKIIFTQADGNEYIDSLNDGYMDYGATTGHRFNNNVLVTSGLLTLGTTSQAGSLELYDGSDHKITLTSPSIAGDFTLTLPTTDGDADQLLTTDGSGNLSWNTPKSISFFERNAVARDFTAQAYTEIDNTVATITAPSAGYIYYWFTYRVKCTTARAPSVAMRPYLDDVAVGGATTVINPSAGAYAADLVNCGRVDVTAGSRELALRCYVYNAGDTATVGESTVTAFFARS